MNQRTMKRTVVIAVAGAVVFGAVSPSWAAPVFSSTSAVREAAPSAVSDVRYRGHRRAYRNNGAGIALGVLGVAGAIAGAAAYDHRYSGDHRYYGDRGYYRQGYYGGGPTYGYGGGPNYYGYRSDY